MIPGTPGDSPEQGAKVLEARLVTARRQAAALNCNEHIGYFMTFPVPENDDRIDRVHSAALRKEIGERLRISLDQRQVEMPPNLLKLMEQLRDEFSNRKSI